MAPKLLKRLCAFNFFGLVCGLAFAFILVPTQHTTAAQSSSISPMTPSKQKQASLSFSLAQESHSKGPVIATVTLKNESNHHLWFNARMLLNTEHAPEPFRELWMEVHGPDGNRLSFDCKIKAGRTKRDQYRVLHVGAQASFVVPLDCYDLSRQGVYRLVLHYQDGTPHPPAPPQDRCHHLRERLTSVSVEWNSENSHVPSGHRG